MATIIESIETGKRYILLGTGYGMYLSTKPNLIFGDLMPNVDKGNSKVICASNKDGKIVWLNSKKMQVISVDGKSPEDLLSAEE